MATNLKQLLIARNDWLSSEIFKGAKAAGYGSLTESEARLLAHMAGKPMSMSELARRLSISRQAVHKTVAELESRGVLEVQNDPQRGNSKLVIYTAKGKELNATGVKIIAQIEARIAEQIGAKDLETLKRILALNWEQT